VVKVVKVVNSGDLINQVVKMLMLTQMVKMLMLTQNGEKW